MTKHDEEFRKYLQVSRNKVEMLLRYHLNCITDAIIVGREASIPFPTKCGYLDLSKNPEKFRNEIHLSVMYNLCYIF